MRVRARWTGKTNHPSQPIEHPVVGLYLDAILFSLPMAGRVVDRIQCGSMTDHHYRWRAGPNVNEAHPIGPDGSSVMEILA